MNTNPSQPPPSNPQKKPLVVASGLTPRDIIVGVFILIGVLGFVVAAIYSSGTVKSPNMLTGEVREKYKTGEQMRDIVVSAEKGNRGVTEKITNSGCYLKVYVAKLDKTYNVMLAESEWDKKKVGDKVEFLRPESEQQ